MSTENGGSLAQLSDALASATESVAPFVVRVDDGTALTAGGVSLGGGYVVAASHATESDDSVIVAADGTRHKTTLVGRDADTDIVLLKADTDLPGVPTVPATPRVGELALAIARPGDQGLTATLGLIAQVQETETAGVVEYIVSTDAVLYPGFSGGVLVNVRGELVGMLNRLYGRGAGVALGAPLVLRVAEELKKHGTRRPGYLGVRTQLVALPENIRAAQTIGQSRGLLVVSVQTGSAAETAGLLLGDTILAIDNSPVEDVDALRHHLIAGATITITVLRGGVKTDLSATVAGAE